MTAPQYSYVQCYLNQKTYLFLTANIRIIPELQVSSKTEKSHPIGMSAYRHVGISAIPGYRGLLPITANGTFPFFGVSLRIFR